MAAKLRRARRDRITPRGELVRQRRVEAGHRSGGSRRRLQRATRHRRSGGHPPCGATLRRHIVAVPATLTRPQRRGCCTYPHTGPGSGVERRPRRRSTTSRPLGPVHPPAGPDGDDTGRLGRPAHHHARARPTRHSEINNHARERSAGPSTDRAQALRDAVRWGRSGRTRSSSPPTSEGAAKPCRHERPPRVSTILLRPSHVEGTPTALTILGVPQWDDRSPPDGDAQVPLAG